MWLSARGNGIDNIVWQQQEHHHHKGMDMGLGLDNNLWYPGIVYPGMPDSRLNKDRCLSLRVTVQQWNDYPGKPYFTESCSGSSGYILCEGKFKHVYPIWILGDILSTPTTMGWILVRSWITHCCQGPSSGLANYCR